MRFASGSTIGAYEIRGSLGKGGMGEVYRALDTRLGREVAIKVLPAGVATDPDRLARFQREAQLLASLSHPQVAAVHGFEIAGDLRALVMELVEGPTLADRIDRGPLPVAEVVTIAQQIADAVEYAHERGVIHRDLKPANIKITDDDRIKVLDFGLAKALGHQSGIRNQASGVRDYADAANSPTLSVAATAAGVILGTAAYMSPEQAKGKAVDRRADIWAFGVIVFEMLTGRMPFAGETASETMALVMTREPDFNALPESTPPALRDLLRRCLVKDARSRMRDMGEARVALEELMAKPAASPPIARELADAAVLLPPSPFARALPWVIAAIAFGATGLAVWSPWSEEAALPPVLRLTVDAGVNAVAQMSFGPAAALSPDGASVVLAATAAESKSAQLFLRRLDQLQAVPLAGTEDARNPFFSPDGAWIGFFAGGKLKKVSTTGGAPVTLADAPDDRGGAWADGGFIVFAPSPRSRLMRVPDGGGSVSAVTPEPPPPGSHRWPHVLPGSDAVLFSVLGGEERRIMAQRFAGGEPTVVQRPGGYPLYLVSGHLGFFRDGKFFAVAFDPRTLTTAGDPLMLVDGVLEVASTGAPQISFSNRGTAVYFPAGAEPGSGLAWIDGSGNAGALPAAPDLYSDVRIAPDGQRIVFRRNVPNQTAVWVYEWPRNALWRLTFEPGNHISPIWTADSRAVTYAVSDPQTVRVYTKAADNSGEPVLLVESRTPALFPMSWHPTGRFLAVSAVGTQTDVVVVPFEPDEAGSVRAGTPIPFAAAPTHHESEPAFSPDGGWLAYQSNETGPFEVYARAFPLRGGRWQISVGGGAFPTWTSEGRQLIYRNRDQLMVVDVAPKGDTLAVSAPRIWSPERIAISTPAGSERNRNFDVQRDGRRAVVLTSRQEKTDTSRYVYVSDVLQSLRRAR